MANRIYLFVILSLISVNLYLHNVKAIESTTVPGTSTSFISNQPFNEFDWLLSKALDKNERINFIASPVSVKLALGMLYLGVLNTPAAKQIEDVLHISNVSQNDIMEKFSSVMHSLQHHKDDGYELNVGTKLFIDESAKTEKEYETQLSKYYNTTIETINFKKKSVAIRTINDWCSRVTKGKIPQLVDEEHTQEGTVMMLLNAIHFKGLWEKQFPVENTRPDYFYISKNKAVLVQMMYVKEKFHHYLSNELEAEVIRLPYQSNKFAMYIIVPYDVDGLSKLAEKMSPSTLGKALKVLEETPEVNVHLSFPKFKFESTAALVPILKQLGIIELFNPAINLDKIGSSPEGPLTVSNILQKSGIEVNEKGTTAYVSTVVEVNSRFGSDHIDVNVSRPFIFFIANDDDKSIIFIGKVINPLMTLDTNESIAVENLTEPANDDSNEQLLNLEENSFIRKKRNARVPGPNPYKVDSVQLDRYNYFDRELLEKLIQTTQGNIVTSPVSIKSALALLVAGARGKTLHELKAALRLPENEQETHRVLTTQQKLLKTENSDIILNSQNKIYLSDKEKLSPNYKKTVTEELFSDVESINFVQSETAANTINNWIKNVTNGFIPSLVTKDSFDASTKLLLTNAIYFKANWEKDFDEKYTRKECFYDLSGTCQEVFMMVGDKPANYRSAKELDARIVELPFKDPRYSMVIILPNKRNGILHLVKDLRHQRINDLFSNMTNVDITISIPRTTIEFSGSIANVLQELDIKDIFSSNANFSGLASEYKSISVKDIVHKAKIEINEQGAKAAAATALQVVLLHAPFIKEFIVDHPFLFFIRDRKLAGFLFEGIVVSPDKADNKPLKYQPVYTQYSLKQKQSTRFTPSPTTPKNSIKREDVHPSVPYY